MLQRVLEPEVMDSLEEALDYDRMDHTAVNRVFVDDLLDAAPELAPSAEIEQSANEAEDDDLDLPPRDVLDIGTGTAQIPIALCRRTDACRVTAIDLGIEMLQLALGNIEVACLRERIRVDRIDAKRLPYADGTFAIVMSNTIVHHIPEPRDVLREALRVTAPDGLLFMRDLLRPVDDAEVENLVRTYAAECNDHQRQLLNQSLRAALSLAEIEELIQEIGLARHAVRQTSDRHWTLAARK